MRTGRVRGRAIDWADVHRRLARATVSDITLSPERARAVLDERARALACVPEQAPAPAETLEIVAFTLAEERYALETHHVREVVLRPALTPVPGAPAFLAGVMNLRGEIVAVMDLRPFLGLPAVAAAEPGPVLVLGGERTEFGVRADTVESVTRVRADGIFDPPEATTGPGRGFLRGVTADALAVLDGSALLADPRLFIDRPGESS
jgi:purine-binding chemotaxis protein CheW